MAHGDLHDRLNTFRDEIAALKSHLSRMCEPSRELSLALTKLDEARLWGHEALTSGLYANTNGESP